LSSGHGRPWGGYDYSHEGRASARVLQQKRHIDRVVSNDQKKEKPVKSQ
jgi:hypothetical protein